MLLPRFRIHTVQESLAISWDSQQALKHCTQNLFGEKRRIVVVLMLRSQSQDLCPDAA